MTWYHWLKISAALQFQCMALAVDAIDRCGRSNEMRYQLQPKETKVTLYYNSKSDFTCCILLTRQSALVLKM